MDGISQRVRSYFAPRASQESEETPGPRTNRSHRHSHDVGTTRVSATESSVELDGVAEDSPLDASLKFTDTQTVRIRMVPYNPYFPVIEKDILPNTQVTIGRFQRHADPTDPFQEGIYFRSTVVSRKHALLMLKNGQLFIKDIKSLGGTFVNNNRLSLASKESLWVRLNLQGGDILQFGIDYRPDATTGQVRNKDRAVEVRVEILTELPNAKKLPVSTVPKVKPLRWKPSQHQHTECCICLSKLYLQQALFIAPCQHTFHYRCIAPLLFQRSSGLFTCPLCRAENDLVGGFQEFDDDDNDSSDDEAIPASAAAPIQQVATKDNKETQLITQQSNHSDVLEELPMSPMRMPGTGNRPISTISVATNADIGLYNRNQQRRSLSQANGQDTSTDTEFDEDYASPDNDASLPFSNSAPPEISRLAQLSLQQQQQQVPHAPSSGRPPVQSARSNFAPGTRTNRNSSVEDNTRYVSNNHDVWEVRGSVAYRVQPSNIADIRQSSDNMQSTLAPQNSSRNLQESFQRQPAGSPELNRSNGLTSRPTPNVTERDGDDPENPFDTPTDSQNSLQQ